MDVWSRLFGYDGNIYYTLAVSLLIIARLLGVLILVPFLGGKVVPTQVKVSIAIALTFAIYPLVLGTLSQSIPDMGVGFAAYIMKEVFIGVSIGFIASLLFQAIETAGQFLDTARGASLANVLIPQLEESGPLSAQLKVQLVIALFLSLNGHHFFLRALFRSFEILPVDRFPVLTGNMVGDIEWIIRATSNVLITAMQMVVPALIAIFLVDLVLGITNRAAPQINVFFMGMPIKAYVGIVMLLFSLPYFYSLLGTQFRLMLRDVNVLMHRIAT